MTTNKQLRELAEKAIRGPWGADGYNVCITRQEGQTTYVETWNAVAEALRIEDARYIAATSPTVVIALLDNIEALQAECERLRKDADRIDWLADPSNSIGNVQLPMAIVRQHLHSLRDAIDTAMEPSK